MYTKLIEEYFKKNKDKMIQDICELIKIPSVVTNPTEGLPYGKEAARAIDKFIEIADQKGFKTANLGYYVAYADFNESKREVDLLTHIDVVPAKDNWTITEPYKPLIREEKIYGRGSADDKGPLIAALYAMCAIKELDIPLKKGVRLVVGANEENGGREDLNYYLEREKCAPMTISPDAEYPIINIEKGSLRGKVYANLEPCNMIPRILKIDAGTKRYVIPGEATAEIKGISPDIIIEMALKKRQEIGIEFKIEAQKEDVIYLKAIGKETHVGAPQEGNNALTGMLNFLCDLPLKFCEGVKQLRGLNDMFPHGDWLGIAAGIAKNTVHSGELLSNFNIFHYTETEYLGSFDCKIPESCTEENTKNVLISNFADKNILVKECELKRAHYVPLDSRLVKTLLKYYEEYTGFKGYGVTINGNTYVHTIENGVAFGCAMPGRDNRMHLSDEFAEIEDLILSAKIYTKVIIDLCS